MVKKITWTLYAGLTLCYAAWQGNHLALTDTLYRNSQGIQVWPTVARSIEAANNLGAAMYYTGGDGQRYTDIATETVRHFNWEEFFKIATFGFGFALLVFWSATLIQRFSEKEKIK